MSTELTHNLIFAAIGMAVASLGWVLPHWLGVREEGWQTGYAAGFKAGVEAQKNRTHRIPKVHTGQPHGPRHPYDTGDYRHDEDE